MAEGIRDHNSSYKSNEDWTKARPDLLGWVEFLSATISYITTGCLKERWLKEWIIINVCQGDVSIGSTLIRLYCKIRHELIYMPDWLE